MVYSEKVTLEREKEGGANPYKAYVDVTAEFSPDGRMTPLRIEWEDGRKYTIDRVESRERMASRKAGGAGIRYLCNIMGQKVELYYEENYRWFVCRKNPLENGQPSVVSAASEEDSSLEEEDAVSEGISGVGAVL